MFGPVFPQWREMGSNSPNGGAEQPIRENRSTCDAH
jgi:hypothetical protein